LEFVQDLNDILRCRFVNRRWSDAAKDSIKRLHRTIQLKTDDELDRFVDCFQRHDHNHNLLVYSKIHFQVHAFSTRSGMEVFFRQYGPQVQELTLDLVAIGGIQPERYFQCLEEVVPFLSLTPFLVHLTLKINTKCTRSQQCKLIDKIQSTYPMRELGGLKSLKLFIPAPSESDWETHFFRAIKHSAHRLQKVIISLPRNWVPPFLFSDLPTLLSIFEDIPNIALNNVYLQKRPLSPLLHDFAQHYECLENVTQKFTELYLIMEDVHCDNFIDDAYIGRVRPCFRRFMERQSESLNKLTLRAQWITECEIPALLCLKELELQLTTPAEAQRRGGGIAPFLKLRGSQFLNLKIVTLHSYKKLYGIFDEADPFESVTKFNFHQLLGEPVCCTLWTPIFPFMKSMNLYFLDANQLLAMMESTKPVLHLSLCLVKQRLPELENERIRAILEGSFQMEHDPVSGLADFEFEFNENLIICI